MYPRKCGISSSLLGLEWAENGKHECPDEVWLWNDVISANHLSQCPYGLGQPAQVSIAQSPCQSTNRALEYPLSSGPLRPLGLDT